MTKIRGLRASAAIITATALGVAGVAVALPATASAPAALPPVGPAATAPSVISGNGYARITVSAALVRQLAKSHISVSYAAPAKAGASGRTREIGVLSVLKDGYELASGLTFRGPRDHRLVCPYLTVGATTPTVYCVDGKGSSVALFNLTRRTVTTLPDGTIHDSGTMRNASARQARVLDALLGTTAFAKVSVLGWFGSLHKRAPLKGGADARTNCEIDNWASDNSINRGWALQALVNQLPQDVTVSQFKDGVLTTPTAPQTTIGQLTPHIDGGVTRNYKEIVRGSQYSTDHYWEGYNYGCSTNAPFVVAPGAINSPSAQAWTYDGELRTKANTGGARTQWWAQPRQTNYDGPTGSYTWTCRGTPSGVPKTDTWWSKVDGGSGFFGDSTDRQYRSAGSTPLCQDANMAGLVLKTRYSISKRGGLEARNDQATYPRYCSVDDNPLVSCWQEIYPAGWDRAWAFQSHVFASALRTELRSDLSITIPATYSPLNKAETRTVAWRISDARTTGAWPSFTAAGGTKYDMKGVATSFNNQDWATTSPFTVPGTTQVFNLDSYGTPDGPQTMTFTLTADTDGTWTWPTNQTSGAPLPRPQVQISLHYDISSYDDGGTCVNKTWYDDGQIAGVNDTTGPHCLQGTVPTIWPLPVNAANYASRVPDTYVVNKDNQRVANVPTTVMQSTVVKGCWNDSQLKVQDLSVPTAPAVGADYTWSLKLTGLINSFASC